MDKVEGFRAQHVFFHIGKLIVAADRRAGYSSNDDPLFRVPSTYLHPTTSLHTLRPEPLYKSKTCWQADSIRGDRDCSNFRMGGMPSRPGGFMSE